MSASRMWHTFNQVPSEMVLLEAILLFNKKSIALHITVRPMSAPSLTVVHAIFYTLAVQIQITVRFHILVKLVLPIFTVLPNNALIQAFVTVLTTTTVMDLGVLQLC